MFVGCVFVTVVSCSLWTSSVSHGGLAKDNENGEQCGEKREGMIKNLTRTIL